MLGVFSFFFGHAKKKSTGKINKRDSNRYGTLGRISIIVTNSENFRGKNFDICEFLRGRKKEMSVCIYMVQPLLRKYEEGSITSDGFSSTYVLCSHFVCCFFGQLDCLDYAENKLAYFFY